ASPVAVFGFPSAAAAGASGSFTVVARDAFGNVVTGYSGTVHFSSSDAQAILPANATLTNGVGTFTATFKTAGTQTLVATDTVTTSITGAEGGIAISPAAASTLSLTGFPVNVTAGAAGIGSVIARDAFGKVVTGYRGTVHFSSSNGNALLPADYTFTATDNGTHTFAATLKTAGTQSLTATDSVNASLNGTEGSIIVAPAAATTLILTGFPASITAAARPRATPGEPPGIAPPVYPGAPHSPAPDPQPVLPAAYPFPPADAGRHTFTIIFKTAATQSLTAADTTGTLSNGSQSGIVVNAAAVARLTGSAPASSIPNAGYPFVVWAVDAYGNQVRNYAGTVHF